MSGVFVSKLKTTRPFSTCFSSTSIIFGCSSNDLSVSNVAPLASTWKHNSVLPSSPLSINPKEPAFVTVVFGILFQSISPLSGFTAIFSAVIGPSSSEITPRIIVSVRYWSSPLETLFKVISGLSDFWSIFRVISWASLSWGLLSFPALSVATTFIGRSFVPVSL